MTRVFQRFTPSGTVCVVSGVVAIVSAWFWGNALAFLIGYALLFGAVFHWFVARWCIQNLVIELTPLAQHARVYAPFPFEAKFFNRSKWLPIRCPAIKIVETGRKRETTLKMPHTLPPGQSVTMAFYPLFGRRGKQRLIAVEAYSRFPFGLTRSSRVFSQVSPAVFIWPELVKPPIEVLREWEHSPESGRTSSRRTPTDKVDPNRFRQYHPGDSRRRINWKLSAKISKLIVTENTNSIQANTWFLINTHPSHWKRPVDFEEGIRLLASALDFGFKRRSLAGIAINNSRISIRGHLDFERVLDQISELGMDLTVDPRVPDLNPGEFLIHSGKKGVTIHGPQSRKVAV